MIRPLTSLGALILGLALVAGPVGPTPAEATPPKKLGPGDAKVHDVGDNAIIRKSKYGYVYISGMHSNHLKVTYLEKTNSLRYHDTRTHGVTSKPKSCKREKVKHGISVVCTIPKRFDHKAMFVQVWPRLGNDYIDGRTLPRRFRMWVLADAGRDVIYGGDGDDFVNAAFDGDRVYGGKGDDWIRSGPGRDHVVGGPGHDRIS